MSSPLQMREEHDRPLPLWLPEPMTKVPLVATRTSRSSWVGSALRRPSTALSTHHHGILACSFREQFEISRE